MKIKSFILAFILLVSLFKLPVSAYSLEEMKITLEDYAVVNSTYKSAILEDFSSEIWEKHGLLVLKDSAYADSLECLSPTDKGKKVLYNNREQAGEKRYLGKSAEQYLVENPDYPADAYNGKEFSQFTWIENSNTDTSIVDKLMKIEDETESKRLRAYYLNIIRESFTKEFGKKYDIEPGSEQEEEMLRAAILVYPMVEGSRTLISFRNLGKNKKIYEITASQDKHTVEKEPEDKITDMPPVKQDTTVQVVLGSHRKGEEIYDVSKGIPTGENLYTYVQAGRYLISYEWQTVETQIEVEEIVTEEISKKGETKKGETKKGDTKKDEMKKDSQATQPLKTKKVKKDISYRYIKKATVYGFQGVEISHPALPGGTVTVPYTGTLSASIESGGVVEDSGVNGSITIDGTSYEAGDSIPEDLKNLWQECYLEGLTIPETIPNGIAIPAKAKLIYKLLASTGIEETEIAKEIYKDANGTSITVHTPVVCYPTLIAKPVKANEEYVVTKEQTLLQKEESFTVFYPAGGKHREIPGYGDRDYSRFTKKTEVRFSFDVYEGTGYDGKFLKGGEWHAIATGKEISYFIPAWSEEGENHLISYRSIPKNLLDEKSQSFGYHANLEPKQYKAVERMEVGVFGKVRDVRIIKVRDKRKYAHLGFPVYPQESYVKGRQDGISLGMPVDLWIETTHDLVNRGASLAITPKYFYVDKKGKREEVDVYYHGNQKLYRINEKNEEIIQRSRLYDYRDVIPDAQIVDTAKMLEEQKRDPKKGYQDYYDALTGKRYVLPGDNHHLKIGDRLKVYSGRELLEAIKKPKQVKEGEVLASRQKWYFRFFLPNESYVVPKGTDFSKLGGVRLSDKPFLREGYLLVQFKIDVFKDNKKIQSYRVESTHRPEFLTEIQYGDSFFYDTERRASQRLD